MNTDYSGSLNFAISHAWSLVVYTLVHYTYREMISQHQQQGEMFQALGEQNITICSTSEQQNIGKNEETQSRSADSANSSEFPGFIIYKPAMKMHSERTERLIICII